MDRKQSRVYLNEGETSGELYLPGFSPCLATLNVKLNSLENPDTRVKLKVGSDYLEVAKGEKFLDNKCWVKDINKEGLYQSVKVYCRDDDKPATVTMGISPRVKLNIEGKTGEYEVGDWLFKTEDKENYIRLVQKYHQEDITAKFIQSTLADEKKLALFEKYWSGEIKITELNAEIEKRDEEIQQTRQEKTNETKMDSAKTYDFNKIKNDFSRIPDNTVLPTKIDNISFTVRKDPNGTATVSYK